jgi:Arc/MetJ family transcription regulator
MRTTLELDQALLGEAMRWTGQPTKTAVITSALKQIIQTQKRLRLIGLAGKVKLPVNLNHTRQRA